MNKFFNVYFYILKLYKILFTTKIKTLVFQRKWVNMSGEFTKHKENKIINSYST